MKPFWITAVGLCAALPSLACAPVPGAGKFVRIAAEQAFIVWDEGAKREHFIRRAAFDTDARDFGFLVPTPSQPELAEADDELFATLARIAAPKVEKVAADAIDRKPAAAVSVLEQKVVSGFDAAVLEATDAAALDRWLRQHGYPSSPELLDWYRPYVDAHWKITAFKIAGEARLVSTKPVRMSFQAERPFFPYREPASQPKAERLLRVYFLADARFAAAIGGKTPWAGKAVWSGQITEQERIELLKLGGMPVMAGGGGRWLTQFDDRSSLRGGNEELFFARAADQSPLEPPAPQPGVAPLPLQTKPGLPLLAIVFLAVAGLCYAGWRLFRRFS